MLRIARHCAICISWHEGICIPGRANTSFQDACKYVRYKIREHKVVHAGLVTEVPANFRVYILEYMAHLSLQDWKAVGQDFVNLQFVAPGSMHPNDIPGLMDAVGGVLEVLMLGGGAKNLENIRVRAAPRPGRSAPCGRILICVCGDPLYIINGICRAP